MSRLAAAGLLVLPAALVVYLGFADGGYFPDTQSLAALVLALLLVVRTAFGERPFEGMRRPLVVAAVALMLLATWTLASASWSDSPARAGPL